MRSTCSARSFAARMIYKPIVLCLCLVSTTGFSQAPHSATESISMRVAGHDIALSVDAKLHLASYAHDMMSGCALNSAAAKTVWNEQLNQPSRLYIHFVKPFENRSWGREMLPISEVLIGFDNDFFIGPEMSRHKEGSIISYSKCSGVLAVDKSRYRH
jgi:hypothetical protein